MPYRAQITSAFEWRVAYRPDEDREARIIAQGTGTSLTDAQTKAQNAVNADRAVRPAKLSPTTIIFDQTFPD